MAIGLVCTALYRQEFMIMFSHTRGNKQLLKSVLIVSKFACAAASASAGACVLVVASPSPSRVA